MRRAERAGGPSVNSNEGRARLRGRYAVVREQADNSVGEIQEIIAGIAIRGKVVRNAELLILHELIAHRLMQILPLQHRGRSFSIV